MELLALARIVTWQCASLWVADVTPAGVRKTQHTDLHSHHAIQVVIALGGRFRLQTSCAEVGGDAAAVAADVFHSFEAEGLIALLFIEPESRTGCAISENLFSDREAATLPSGIAGDIGARIATAYHAQVRNDETLVALGNALLARMAGNTIACSPDLRVRKVIAWAAGRLETPIRLADAARVGGLSAGRLRHLFVEQTGLPLRTYLLWMRLTRGIQLLAEGQSLTHAAHRAGFADSAHFSRTFRRMFGIAPTNLRIS